MSYSKIKKSELKNIISLDWDKRRLEQKEKSKKHSAATKEWKKRIPKAEQLIEKLEKSANPHDQADAYVIKKLLEILKYEF